MPGARRAIAADRAAGRRLVMATASYRLYAAAIARRLGFDDVIATETGIDAKGRIVARIDGANCYGPAKMDMILAWLQREGLERDAVHIRFYSDHVSDHHVHRWSDEAGRGQRPFAAGAAGEGGRMGSGGLAGGLRVTPAQAGASEETRT